MVDNIKCPQCENTYFELHKAGEIAPSMINVLSNPDITCNEIHLNNYVRNFLTCTGCGYIIKDANDINLTEVIVFVIPNSISGQRHGITRISESEEFQGLPQQITPMSFPNKKRLFSEIVENILLNKGCYQFTEDCSVWIFTEDKWRSYQTDPTPLIEDVNYTTKVVDCT